MFVMATKNKELFASTLNGITASVRCVSFIIVILNAKLTQLIAAAQTNPAMRNGKIPKRVPFFTSQTHEHLTSIAVLNVHTKTGLLCTFQRSMRANRNINLW